MTEVVYEMNKSKKQQIDIMVFNGPGNILTRNALLTADSLLTSNVGVVVILREDGVFCALKEMDSESLKGLINLGAEVLVCGICLDARGYSSDKFLIEGVKRCCMQDITNVIKEADKVLVFGCSQEA